MFYPIKGNNMNSTPKRNSFLHLLQRLLNLFCGCRKSKTSLFSTNRKILRFEPLEERQLLSVTPLVTAEPKALFVGTVCPENDFILQTDPLLVQTLEQDSTTEIADSSDISESNEEDHVQLPVIPRVYGPITFAEYLLTQHRTTNNPLPSLMMQSSSCCGDENTPSVITGTTLIEHRGLYACDCSCYEEYYSISLGAYNSYCYDPQIALRIRFSGDAVYGEDFDMELENPSYYSPLYEEDSSLTGNNKSFLYLGAADTLRVFAVNNDGIPENDEEFTVILEEVEKSTCDPDWSHHADIGTHTLTIEDDDHWKIDLSGEEDAENGIILYEEGTTSTIYTLTRVDDGTNRFGDLTYAIDVTLGLSGTASDSDYSTYIETDTPGMYQSLGHSNGTIIATIPAGSESVNIKIQAANDSIIERLEESLMITMISAINGFNGPAQYMIDDEFFEITLIDDDKLILNSVSFTNNLNLISDTAGSFDTSWQTGPHWINGTSSATLPLAYSAGNQNNILKCDAVTIGTIDPAIASQVQVRFKWGDEWGEDYSQWVTLSSNKTVNALQLQKTFAQHYGAQMAMYETLSLNWEFRVGNEEEREINEVSENPLYVTYSDPVISKLYHSVVHIGCAAASGVSTNETDVFLAVWRKFTSLNINKVKLENGDIVSDALLTYYGQEVENSSYYSFILAGLEVTNLGGSNNFNFDQSPTKAREFAGNSLTNTFKTSGLLAKTDGTCGAWQDFACDVLGTQGITVHKEYVLATPSTIYSTLNAFKIKTTIRGQGGGVPLENIWGDHALISYNNWILDPSYGVSYGTTNIAAQTFVNNLHSVGTITSNTGTIVATMGYGGIYTPQKLTSNIVVDINGNNIKENDLIVSWIQY
jgi:hypothetical protein